MKFPSAEQLQDDLSNTQARSEMRAAGWHRRPIIRFGQYKYVILHHVYPRPGPMRIDVINVTEFDQDSPFSIFRLRSHPWSDCEEAYVTFTDEGIGILTVYKDRFTEWCHPPTAVLTFRIESPTPEDLKATADELDSQLQEGFDWPIR